MAEHFLEWELFFLEERVYRYERRIEMRILRDAQNPFEIPHDEFLDHFRLSPHLIMDIVNTLRPHLEKERINGLSPEIQVLVAINFYAHGSYQKPVGAHSTIIVSQPSTSRCINKVTNLFNEHLLRRWIKFPMTPEERQEARRKFTLAPQSFEGAIGAIDCTYIHILAPPRHEEAYVNHHGNHSLNVQAIVDPSLKVLNINARYPGARNDAYIWSASPIRRAMEFHYNHGERRTWLIGDAGYPLEPWLLTPLPHYPDWSRQFQYNEQLCKARSIVERFFGVLKGRWRCLSYQRVLMYDPGVAGKMVNACCILHNMALHYRLPLPPDIVDCGEDFGAIRPHVDADNLNIDERIRGPRAIAERIQRQIMQERFPNFVCAWENN